MVRARTATVNAEIVQCCTLPRRVRPRGDAMLYQYFS